MRSSEKIVWAALGILAWLLMTGVLVYYVATDDTTVVCSNNAPC